MDKRSLKAHLEELRNLPTNELNIRRLSEVTTAIKNFEMLDNSEPIETAAEKELDEAEENYKSYLRAKQKYAREKTQENAQKAAECLTKTMLDIEQSISEMWSACNCEAEKEIILSATERIESNIKGR